MTLPSNESASDDGDASSSTSGSFSPPPSPPVDDPHGDSREDQIISRLDPSGPELNPPSSRSAGDSNSKREVLLRKDGIVPTRSKDRRVGNCMVPRLLGDGGLDTIVETSQESLPPSNTARSTSRNDESGSKSPEACKTDGPFADSDRLQLHEEEKEGSTQTSSGCSGDSSPRALLETTRHFKRRLLITVGVCIVLVLTVVFIVFLVL